jgi:hypothetical protein
MWFDPLAPADKKPQPSAPDTTSTKADADEEEEWLTNPEEKPKAKRNAKPKPSAGAPLKEAEALVPQLVPEAPKAVVSALQVEAAPLSHNL